MKRAKPQHTLLLLWPSDNNFSTGRCPCICMQHLTNSTCKIIMCNGDAVPLLWWWKAKKKNANSSPKLIEVRLLSKAGTQRTEQDWNTEKRGTIWTTRNMKNRTIPEQNGTWRTVKFWRTQRTKQPGTGRTEQFRSKMEHGEQYNSGEHREQNNPEQGEQNKSRAIWNLENRSIRNMENRTKKNTRNKEGLVSSSRG